ncbi:MAG: M6 family metalloprotease domain-containing protein [Chitinispirillaceae bacterium]|nr:M6 family metalloprotease domain-containing protein [Chitinispirillaceae bacterium]
MTMLVRRAFLLILVTGIYHASFSLIVWEGKIVASWPDHPQPFLRKSSSRPFSSSASEGFGFYPRPAGKIYSLAMIVDFSDQPAAFSREEIEDWLNKPGFSAGSTKGSVRDYYYECSNGKLELVNDVAGYYRAKKTKAYYESVSGYSGSDELVEEMIAHFDSIVDFSKYDNDKNGATEAINFVYAGSGKTWGQGLWPHAGYLGKKRDGVQIGRYNMSDMGTSLTLYVFCHETGHMLFGWPDLYWFGDYCIMGNRMSDPNPQAINDFFRADQGWIPTTDVVSIDNKAFTACHNGGGFRYVNPAVPGEMFYWSVMNNTGRWSNVRGRGILIYHFDDRIDGNTSADKRTLFVVEADGNNRLASAQWPDPGDEAADFFSAGNKSEFSASTTPASSWGLRIYDISAAGDTMSFKVGTGVVAAAPAAGNLSAARRDEGDLFTLYNLLGRAYGCGRPAGSPRHHIAPGCYVLRGDEVRILH